MAISAKQARATAVNTPATLLLEFQKESLESESLFSIVLDPLPLLSSLRPLALLLALPLGPVAFNVIVVDIAVVM